MYIEQNCVMLGTSTIEREKLKDLLRSFCVNWKAIKEIKDGRKKKKMAITGCKLQDYLGRDSIFQT
ncbi:CLUMA_CG011301, isoform A [Clunio marinus]|uniref:CLUMA_CG011301, isoform A n=1 Tax=Clunio marinus TaxID=568069 RepID=A0A1J1ICH3_9DIPT|nr:CLUMA_CG011301, isoform A [Clunio marinus]